MCAPYACASDQRMLSVALTALPEVRYALIASTSGPLGNVPLPPIGVLVSSFSSERSIVSLDPGAAVKAKTCSPGVAAPVRGWNE